MNKTGILSLITSCIIVAMSCCPEKAKDDVSIQRVFKTADYGDHTELMIVDTIIYDVIIKNPNPYDTWTDECLKHLNKEQFVDLLFESVYKNQATAYDVLSQNIITSVQLKKLEHKKDFDRDKIGKIQFTESWFYNDSLRTMSKRVISVSLGYEIFDDKGELIGHKPAFKIFMN
jgi:hypothetical protein